MPWNINIYGTNTDIYHLVQWFFIYSIAGWIIESIYMSFCEKKWVNRGFIFGPICPIYGFGALGAYFLLKPFSGNYILLYIFGSLMATIFEYLVARLMLFIFGQVWWDYNNKPFNYKGILCLESTIAWGFYTIIMFGLLQKGVMLLADTYSYRAGCIFGGICIIYYLIDFTVHLCKVKYPAVPEKVREIRVNIINFYR